MTFGLGYICIRC